MIAEIRRNFADSETTQDICKVMPGISSHDATQGTKGRKRWLSKYSVLYFRLESCLFSGGKGGDKPKPKDDKKGGGGKGGKEGGKKGK